MFFKRSDWLLKLGIVSAIHLGISRASFNSFFNKKGTIWCWLFTGLVYTKTISHLSVGDSHPAKDAVVVETLEDDSSVLRKTLEKYDCFATCSQSQQHTLPLFGISLILQYMLLKLKSLRTGVMI